MPSVGMKKLVYTSKGKANAEDLNSFHAERTFVVNVR